MNYAIKVLTKDINSLVKEKQRIESITMYEAPKEENKRAINLINDRLKDLNNTINILNNKDLQL